MTLMLHRLTLPVALVLAAALLTGCGTKDSGGTRVVAAFYPLAWAAEEVVGKDATVTDLTTPGVEPHDLELTARQTALLSAADLVLFEKDFQPSVDASVKQNARASLDVAKVVPLHQTAEGADPHFWQDPLLMARYVDALGKRLGEVDPTHAKAYASRAASLQKRLERLDADYQAGLADCKVHTIVVSHDAFGYLAKYGIEVRGIAGLSPDAEPSAKHLQELSDLIRTDGITTVFSETLASPKMSDALAHDLGLSSEVLDPIEGVAKDAPKGTDYLTIMRANLKTLEKANSCS
jgi:zinc transport system substrate-binding protein